MESQSISLDELTLDTMYRVREYNDEGVIMSYAECMETEEDFQKFPPIEVYYDGSSYWVADGRLRCLAAKKAGHKKIHAHITEGDRLGAFWASIVANGRQGFGLSWRDRQRVVTSALRCWPDRSNQAIAVAVGVSEGTVRRFRAKLTEANEIENPQKRVGVDGKRYPTRRKQTVSISPPPPPPEMPKRGAITLKSIPTEKAEQFAEYINANFSPEYRQKLIVELLRTMGAEIEHHVRDIVFDIIQEFLKKVRC